LSDPLNIHTPPLEVRDIVGRKLHRAWRKERRYWHLNGLCRLLLWLVALVLVDFLVDWIFQPPGWGRLLLLAINVVVLAGVAWRSWWRHLTPYDPVRVALEVESRHPELRSLLVSYVQIGRGDWQDASASPALISALRKQAVDVTRPMDFREIISYKQLQRIMLMSLGVLGLFAVISVNWGDLFHTLLVRMLNPAATVRYPTQTQIVEVTGDTTVKEGQPLILSARWAGQQPRRTVLMVRPEGGRWERLHLSEAAEDRFAYELPEVFQSFDYYMLIGDDRSDEYRATVVPAPHVIDTEVALEYPEYTGLSPDKIESLNFETYEGTKVQWRLKLDRPVSKAEVLVPAPAETDEQGTPLPTTAPTYEAREMAVAPDGMSVRWSATAEASMPYRFRWVEAEHGYVYEEDVRYAMQVLADNPPEVEIVYPMLDEKATLQKTLVIDFRARDDFGLSEAWIDYTVNGGQDIRTVPVELVADREDQTAVWRLQSTIDDLAEGDEITYAIRVADNRDDGREPQTARSMDRRLTIVSVPEYLAYMMEKYAANLEEIRALHEQETEASEQVGEIKQKIPDPTTRPESP
jgi:hypothetical protein